MDVVKWIFLSSFLDLFAVSLLIPLMGSWLKELGASHFLMGSMTSIYALSQLVSGPIVGSWSDRIGRQEILFFSLIAAGCCYALLGLLDSLILIAFLRAGLGTFKHTQVLIHAIIADKVSGDQHALVFGRMKAVAGISFALGPLVSGSLAELQNGFRYICYCVGGIFLLNSALVRYFLVDSSDTKSHKMAAPEEGRDATKATSSIASAIRDLANVDWSIYWDIFAMKFLTDFSVGAFHNNYSLKLVEKFNTTPKMAGYTISLQSFTAVCAGIFIEKFNEKFYRDDVLYRKRSIHAYAIMVIAYLGIWATESVGHFIFWAIVLKSVHMLLRIVMTELTIKKCPANQRGSVIGTVNSVSNIARLITPLLTGFFQDLWGSNSSNLLAAVAAIFGLLVSIKLGKQRRKIS